jgi:hypothetical protein
MGAFRRNAWGWPAAVFLALAGLGAAAPAGEPSPTAEGSREAAPEAPAPGPSENRPKPPGGEAGPPAPTPAKPAEKTPIPFLVPETKDQEEEKSLLVLTPRAIGYRTFLERVQVGCGSQGGSSIQAERHLGLENTEIVSPAVNMEIDTKILELPARLQFSYFDTDLHGVARLGKDIAFGRTLFPLGTVVGSNVHTRRVQLRYIQNFLDLPEVEADFTLGAEYLYFYNRIDAPGLTHQEETTEAGLPLLGGAVRYTPVSWWSLFLQLQGFYWNLGRDTGETGSIEIAAGTSLRFTRTWGFILSLSFSWTTIGKGRASRVEIGYMEYGPELALYASL